MSLGFCDFSPTHSPNPSLAPPGERGGLHVAACWKAGTLRFTARWPQSECATATGRHSQISHRTSWSILNFPVCRPETAHADQALPQRQLAPTCLQQIENPRPQFDGNAPLRAFFPPSLTRPHVAVSSLSAPAGVERAGERGGIQRLKNKNAADNRFGRSTAEIHRFQKILQKQEQTMHIARGLEVKKAQRTSPYLQIAIQELTA